MSQIATILISQMWYVLGAHDPLPPCPLTTAPNPPFLMDISILVSRMLCLGSCGDREILSEGAILSWWANYSDLRTSGIKYPAHLRYVETGEDGINMKA